jgi:hypothetical protein
MIQQDVQAYEFRVAICCNVRVAVAGDVASGSSSEDGKIWIPCLRVMVVAASSWDTRGTSRGSGLIITSQVIAVARRGSTKPL